jgi:hypothetical protein
MDTFPIEIIYNIFMFLDIRDIYQKVILLSKEYREIVESDGFVDQLIRNKHPIIYGLRLRSKEKENLKLIYRVMDKRIKPRDLELNFNRSVFRDKMLVLPYSVIAKLLRLPELENIYMEIMGYLRCDNFEFEYLKDFYPDIYRVTFFVMVRNNEIFSNATFRQELEISFEELIKNIIPINIKDDKQFINTENIHAITLITQKDYSYKIYYSSLNHYRENIISVFKVVREDYRAKYA